MLSISTCHNERGYAPLFYGIKMLEVIYMPMDLEDLVRELTEIYEEHGNMQVEYFNQAGEFELSDGDVSVTGGDLSPKMLSIRTYY